MDRRQRLLLAALLLAPAALLVYIFHTDRIDVRLPARPGGTLSADIVLGSGISFDRGSLEIVSHEDDDVRVEAATTGWGKYAVDVEARERQGDVQVVGRVQGLLHWIFGGPGLDVKISVPEGYGVDAEIDGGPLRLSDLAGMVDARLAKDSDETLTLRRVDGIVKLAAHAGEVKVEDVEGALKVESNEGSVRISGVEGNAVVASQEGEIAIAHVEGDVHVATRWGHVQLDDIAGDVDVETEDASVDITDLDGRIRARSRHGEVEVEFRGAPAGAIETEGGSIAVEVPRGAGFDLTAEASPGSIELDDDLAFVAREEPQAELGPVTEQGLRDATQLGLEIAAEVRDKVLARVHHELERYREGARRDGWEGDRDRDWDWDWDWSWDDPDWKWHHHDWGRADEHDEGGHFRLRRRLREPRDREERLHGEVNGGGETLALRTRGGRIRVD